MKRIITLVVGVIAILVGLGFILPALAQLRTQGFLPGFSVVFLILGAFLAIGGVSAAFLAIRRPRA